jgi:hypothetical protein
LLKGIDEGFVGQGRTVGIVDGTPLHYSDGCALGLLVEFLVDSVLGTSLGHANESEVSCDICSKLGILDGKALGTLLGVDDGRVHNYSPYKRQMER